MKFDPVDPEEIKEKVAESRKRIHDCLRALELPDDIQQKIIDGIIELKDALDKYLPDDEN